MCCLGYFAFLQSGEITASQGQFDSCRHLTPPLDLAVDDHRQTSHGLGLICMLGGFMPSGSDVGISVSLWYRQWPTVPTAKATSVQVELRAEA